MTVWKPHVTVAAITERDNRFLIVQERVDGKLVYNQPAGHLDDGESLIDAVIRETLEETGWHFEPEALVGVQLWRHPVHDETYLRFAFCGRSQERAARQPLDKGIVQAVWLSHDQLLDNHDKLRSPLVLRSIDEYLAGRRYSLDMLEHIASDIGH